VPYSYSEETPLCSQQYVLPKVLDLIPGPAVGTRGLDVSCGNGAVTAELTRRRYSVWVSDRHNQYARWESDLRTQVDREFRRGYSRPAPRWIVHGQTARTQESVPATARAPSSLLRVLVLLQGWPDRRPGRPITCVDEAHLLTRPQGTGGQGATPANRAKTVISRASAGAAPAGTIPPYSAGGQA
jgi:hypothetical protein